MSYFLFKTEPDVYSFDDFLATGKPSGTASRTNCRQAPARDEGGTKWIFYHTGDERTAVAPAWCLAWTLPIPRFLSSA